MDRIVAVLNEADTFMKQGQYEEAAAKLGALWNTKSKDPMIEKFESAIVAWYSESLFASGRPEQAQLPGQRSLELCHENKDQNGVVECLSNLMEIHRYRGEKDAAAKCATGMAAIRKQQGKDAECEELLKMADAIAKGEPPLRILIVAGTQRLELHELASSVALLQGKVEVTYCRNRVALKGSTARIDKGKELLIKRDFAAALEEFRAARAIDPLNPNATYQEGFVHLWLKNCAEAKKCFDVTNALAPGWANINFALWLTQAMAEDQIDDQTYQLIKVAEDSITDPKHTVDLLEHFFKQSPLKAPRAILHLLFGQALQRLKQADRALESFKAGLTEQIIDTDTKTRLLFAVASGVATTEEKSKYLDLTIQENGNLLVSAMAQLTKLIS